MSASNGNGDHILRTQLPDRGMNRFLFADVKSGSYATPFRTFARAVSPYGQVLRRISTNHSWGSTFDVEYPGQCDFVAETFTQVNLPALTKASIDGVAFDVFYGFHVGAAMIDRLEFEPKGSSTMERMDRWSIETHRALFCPTDSQMPQASFISEDVQDWIKWSSVAQELWTRLPLYHSIERLQAYPVSAALGSTGTLHFTLSSQDSVCQSLPAADSAVYNSTTPWGSNTISLNLWFMCIYITPEEQAQVRAHAQFSLFAHFLSPKSISVDSVAAGSTSTVQVEIPWVAALRYVAIMFVSTTNLSSRHDVFNFNGAGTNANPVDPIQAMQIESDGDALTAEHGPLYFREVQPHLYAKQVPNKHIYLYSFGGDLDNLVPQGTFQTNFVKRVRLNVTLQGNPTDGATALPAGKLYLVGSGWNALRVHDDTLQPVYTQ